MAEKTNCIVRGKPKYRLTKVVGKRRNENGVLVPVRRTVYGKNKKDAEERIRKIIDKFESGIDGEGQYFGLLADEWIKDFLLPDTRLKDRTKELYVGQWNKYVKPSTLYHMELSKITASTVQSFYNELDAPFSAVKTLNKVMKRFYKYLEFAGYSRDITGVLTIPPKNKSLQSTPPAPMVWSDEEIGIIMNNFDKADPRFRFKFLLIMAYHTGCRISELLGMKYSDIDNNKILTVSRQVICRPIFSDGKKVASEMGVDTLKTDGSYRHIPLNSIVIEALKEHTKWHQKEMRKKGYITDFIFTTDSGGLIDQHNAERAVMRYYKRIGVEYKGFHTYRHTFGSNLCRYNVPIQVASTLLGHSDINVTMKYYINVPGEDKRDAVELLAEGIRSSGLVEEMGFEYSVVEGKMSLESRSA